MTAASKDLLAATTGGDQSAHVSSDSVPAPPVPIETKESREATGPGQELEAGEG